MSPLHLPLVSGHIWRTMHSRTTLELCFKLSTINKIPLSEDKEIQYTYIYKPIIHWPRLNSQKYTETLQWTKPVFKSSYLHIHIITHIYKYQLCPHTWSIPCSTIYHNTHYYSPAPAKLQTELIQCKLNVRSNQRSSKKAWTSILNAEVSCWQSVLNVALILVNSLIYKASFALHQLPLFWISLSHILWGEIITELGGKKNFFSQKM